MKFRYWGASALVLISTHSFSIAQAQQSVSISPPVNRQPASIASLSADSYSSANQAEPFSATNLVAMMNESEDEKAQSEMTPEEKNIRSILKKIKDEDAAKKAKEEKEAKEKAEAEGYVVGSDLAMTANWNNGIELASKNKDFKFHVGGRYQLDNGWISAADSVQNNLPNGTRYHDGTDFRRARLRADGTMYETMDWAAEFDFVNSFVVRTPGFSETSAVAPTDLWWQFREVPLFGQVRIGNQKEQIGFEHIVSSRYLPFMERSFNQDTFYGGSFNGFNPGIQFFRNYGDEKGVISGGLFRPVNNVFASSIGDGDYSIVARMTRLMWYGDNGANLLHVGVSGRQASAINGNSNDPRTMVFRTRDAFRTGLSGDWPQPARIALFGDDMQWANGEIAAVYGSWTFQSEYLVSGLQDSRRNAADALGTTAVYHGGYIQILRFLTGEHDNYNKTTGVFERVKPNENFFFVKNRCDGRCLGAGAWQVGMRYNYLDLNDKNLNGGILHNLTTGLNWFWNPNAKMQFNYTATYRDVSQTVEFPAGSGWIHGFGTRFAIDF